MGRKYSVNFLAVAVTAQQDFFGIIASSTKPYIIHSVRIGQSSDAGDAQDEMLQIAIKRGATSAGSGGGTMTPNPLDAGDAAFGGTARINDTTVASGGTIVTMVSDAFNVRSGWVYLPTPEERIVVTAGIRAQVVLLTTPADSLTINGTMIIEEIG